MDTVQLTLDARMQFILKEPGRCHRQDPCGQCGSHPHGSQHRGNPGHGQAGPPSIPTIFPGASGAFLNRGVSIVYEPGSVFKPIMGSAALMEGIITPTTPF